MSEEEENSWDDWIDWHSHGLSLCMSIPICMFGWAAAKYGPIYFLGAAAWHFIVGFVVSFLYQDDEDYE